LNNQSIYSIDGWQIDVDSHRITRNGTEKKLEPRGLELLLYLAARPNQVVSRREIEDEIWRERVVGYDALSGTIAKLRKAFEDTSKNPRVIETIPKSGYRLIAQVLVATDQHVPESREPSGENFERKLAAILYADVAGYSRLSGEDEDRTHRQLRQNMKTISELIVKYQGRIIHYAGDAVLADFSTASTALHCALKVQQQIAEINSHLAEHQRVLFRIGVNLGEVIVDGEEIYGEGVNVAARLEALAEAGGVCISGAVFDAIGQKQSFDFEYHGEKSMKNILRPVQTYSVHPKPGVSISAPEVTQATAPPKPSRDFSTSKTLGFAAATAILIVAAVFTIQLISRPTTVAVPEAVMPIDESTPSLAVLPFRNTSNNPGQTVYSDGLTDDLITDFSNVDGLMVTPRHSSFIYQDSDKAVRDIASELGVRYILQGSVRRSLGEIRVNAQLLDVSTDQQVWAQRFDDKIENLFKLQDQLVAETLRRIDLAPTTKTPSQRRSANLEAYDYFLRAEHRRINDHEESRRIDTLMLYQKAVQLDPKFVAAHIGLAREALFNWQLDASQVMPAATSRKLVYEAAGKALELDPDNAEALSILGLIQTVSGAHDAGLASVKRAVGLDSKNPWLHADLAEVLSFSGSHERALESINTAIELHDLPPSSFFKIRAYVYFFLRQFPEALQDMEKPGAARSDSDIRILVHGALNDPAAAKPLVAAKLEEVAWFNQEYFRVNYAYYRRAEDIQLVVDSFASAGIPRFAYGYDPGSKLPLDDAGIESLIDKGLWQGVTFDQGDFFQQFHGEDGVAVRTPDAMMSGNYYVRDGKLCVTYRSVLLDLPDCGYIYPDGDATHFTWVTLGEVYRFSIAGS
jgi:adenylate cyclase